MSSGWKHLTSDADAPMYWYTDASGSYVAKLNMAAYDLSVKFKEISYTGVESPETPFYIVKRDNIEPTPNADADEKLYSKVEATPVWTNQNVVFTLSNPAGNLARVDYYLYISDQRITLTANGSPTDVLIAGASYTSPDGKYSVSWNAAAMTATFRGDIPRSTKVQFLAKSATRPEMPGTVPAYLSVQQSVTHLDTVELGHFSSSIAPNGTVVDSSLPIFMGQWYKAGSFTDQNKPDISYNKPNDYVIPSGVAPVSLYYRVNGAETQSVSIDSSAKYDFYKLSDVKYDLEVWLGDAAGNTTSSVEFTLRADRTVPENISIQAQCFDRTDAADVGIIPGTKNIVLNSGTLGFRYFTNAVNAQNKLLLSFGADFGVAGLYEYRAALCNTATEAGKLPETPKAELDANEAYSAVTGSTMLLDNNFAGRIFLTVEDEAGNTKTVATDGIVVETTKPEATLQPSGTINEQGWYSSHPIFTITPSDGSVEGSPISDLFKLEVKEHRGDDVFHDWAELALPGDNETSIRYETKSNGRFTISVRVTDKAGNSEVFISGEVELKVDTTTPTIKVEAFYGKNNTVYANGGTDQAATPWINQTVNVKVSGGTQYSNPRYEYKIGNGAWIYMPDGTASFGNDADFQDNVTFRVTSESGISVTESRWFKIQHIGKMPNNVEGFLAADGTTKTFTVSPNADYGWKKQPITFTISAAYRPDKVYDSGMTYSQAKVTTHILVEYSLDNKSYLPIGAVLPDAEGTREVVTMTMTRGEESSTIDAVNGVFSVVAEQGDVYSFTLSDDAYYRITATATD